MSQRMTQAEMDELWEAVRDHCPPTITRDVFEFWTRILEQIKTPEDAERLAVFVKTGKVEP